MTGSVSLRSTARPPDSAMRTMTCASSGRVRLGSLSSLTVKGRLALLVGRRQILQRLRGRVVDLLVGQAEAIAGEARPLLGGADHDLAFEDRAWKPARRRG